MNVKRPTGEFPEGFLVHSNQSAKTRLAQLEEKWREAEEREAELKAQKERDKAQRSDSA